MKSLHEFKHKINYILTDIDDTLTDDGQLGAEAYTALWSLHRRGIRIIPVTGRPAGWCEMIARLWPVSAVVGENGGFYFRYHNKHMKRFFVQSPDERSKNQRLLKEIEKSVLSEIPGSQIASDQFCRLIDLAIDFCEDVPPLAKSEVYKIVDIFNRFGAQAKISSIHVNGWFGNHDKLSTSLLLLEREFNLKPASAKSQCAFSGDSPNDEPMFEYFPHSFAVANLNHFIDDVDNLPAYISPSRGGLGFKEIADAILKNSK